MSRAALLALLLAAPALADEIRGTVLATLDGAPKADRSGVVVFVTDVPLRQGPRPEAVMAQRSQQFVPQVLVVPVGTVVAFPNRDGYTEHNVFSRSPHASFDLGRYAQGGSKSHAFDEAGVVDVYCNIHPHMIGHVVVVPGPWGVSDRDGNFVIRGIPPGSHAVVVWDRFASPTVRRLQVQVPGGPLTVPLAENAAEPPHPNKFGGAYRAKSY